MEMIEKAAALKVLDGVKEKLKGRDDFVSGVCSLAEATVRSLVDQMPTVEAEPVIRCRDCKHLDWSRLAEMYYCKHWDADYYEEAFVKLDDFCSHAERKG